ncbi:FIST signal transduction protein [Halorientalis sp.]|uniref:FIST signal transduction protein n=1 Tax=Halorientalis sp. TaxID=1931229 RepID=UPI002635AB50|nr:FIST C-terminal domain-containing protein [Halorientalis sp.]
MRISYAETMDVAKDEGKRIASAPDIEGLALFTASVDSFDSSFEAFLRNLDVPVFGGLFPELIYRGEKKESGTVVCGLTTPPDVTTVPELSDPTQEYTNYLHPDLPVEGYETAFVFVDAYATNVERFVESLFRTYSVELNYIGGGAGTLETEQQPCLFTGDGVIEDSAVVAAVDSPLQLGVKHGWQEIAGPFRVTDADGPTLQTLDGAPAFSVYKETVDEHASAELTRDDFFETAKEYPFGIARIDSEQIVRDPFEVTDDDGLSCFGDVPSGEFVNILEGQPESLIDAAAKAKEQTGADEADAEALFFFDCISRVLYLNDEFERELDSVRTDGTPTVGALTIGEIANDGSGHLDYYNKTAVVGSVDRI